MQKHTQLDTFGHANFASTQSHFITRHKKLYLKLE